MEAVPSLAISSQRSAVTSPRIQRTEYPKLSVVAPSSCQPLICRANSALGTDSGIASPLSSASKTSAEVGAEYQERDFSLIQCHGMHPWQQPPGVV